MIHKKDQKENLILEKLCTQELSVMQMIDHHSMPKVYELIEDDRNFYIVSELLAEDLAHRLIRRKRMTEKDAATIFSQILMALNYMHSQKIVHRDIKLENVLMSSVEPDNLDIKVTDFGFAASYKDQSLDDILGSPLYMAPEIIRNEKYDDKVDIWAGGVLLHILLVGKPPFTATGR